MCGDWWNVNVPRVSLRPHTCSSCIFKTLSFFKQCRPLLIYHTPTPAHGAHTRAHGQTHNGRRVPQMKTRLLSDDRCRTGTYSMLILSTGSSVRSPIARQAHLMSLLFFPPSLPRSHPTVAPSPLCVFSDTHMRPHSLLPLHR